MTLLTVAVLLVVCAAAALAIVGTLRSSHSPVQKTIFVVLRSALTLCFIIAFLEPVFTLHRVPRKTPRLMVLADASTSMTFFADDTTIDVLLHGVSAAAASHGAEAGIMLFGDSLREKNAATPYRAADRTSVFPSIRELATAVQATGTLILSDGNWSNAAPITRSIDGKPVWYHLLQQVRYPATLTLEAPDTVIVPADTKRVVSMRCSGTMTTPSVIRIRLLHNDAVISTDTIIAGPGPFSRATAITLPPQPAGLRRYCLQYDCGVDSLSRMRFLVCRATPSVFRYTVVSGAPSVDERFLRLALGRSNAFREAEIGASSREQVRFILHRPEAQLPPPGVLPVYIGCLPVAAVPQTDATAAARFFPVGIPDNPLDKFNIADAPPIVPLRPLHPVKPGITWLRAASGSDTLPLLFSARIKNRPYVACAFKNLWQWDFLTLSQQNGEADAGRFSEQLLAITAMELMAAADDTLLAWPSGTVGANAGFTIAVITPRIVDTDSAAAPSLLRCSITGSSGRFDTAAVIAPGGLRYRCITMPPLQRGDHRMNCTLSIGGRTFTDAIPFTVTADDHELLANGQNTALLDEAALSVDANDSAALAAIFGALAAVRGADAAPLQRIALQRSWWLLCLLLAFFGTEWFLRRMWRQESNYHRQRRWLG